MENIELTPQELALLLAGLDSLDLNGNRELIRAVKALSDRLREARDGAVLSMATA